MPVFVTCEIASIDNRKKSATVRGLYVGPQFDYTCIDGKVLQALGVSAQKECSFQLPSGQKNVMRAIGYIILRAHGFETVDEVVFGEPGDILMLGSRTLAGFRAKAEPGKKRLMASGPVPAAPNRPEDWR